LLTASGETIEPGSGPSTPGVVDKIAPGTDPGAELGAVGASGGP
jgi:hypothetical protein